MSVNHTKLFWHVGPALTVALAASAAVAETAESEETAAGDSIDRIIEVVIVTAEKRKENILKVPLAMSAFNDRMIKELGMTNSKDIEQLVPGLQFGNDNVRWGQGTAIRGIGSRNWGEVHSDLAVATYVDGVYSRSAISVAPNLFDVDRLEVGRGPQGTLNGRNSIAGSVSYITKRPTDEWDVDVLAEFTDQFTQRYNIAFGGPLSEPFSFRITGGYHEGDGAQKNIGFGDDYDAPKQTSIAPQLRLRSDKLDINLRYARHEDTGSPETEILLYDPRRDLPYNCWQEDTDGEDTFLPADQAEMQGPIEIEIDGEEVEVVVCDDGTPESPTNVWYRYTEPSPAVADCGDTIATRCSELKNEINLNRSGIQDTSRESITLNADFNPTETLTLRYTYGWSDVQLWGSNDLDRTNRIPSASDPTLSADAGTPFRDQSLTWPYFEENESHEIQLFSHFDGPFNFIVGAFVYENSTDNQDLAINHTHPLRFTNSDETARQLDIDDDGTGDFADCNDLLENLVLEVFEEDLEEGVFGITCPEGALLAELGNTANDHLNWGRTISRAAAETNAIFVSGEYRFSDQWQISGGLRWTEDEKSQDRNGDVGYFTFRADGPGWDFEPDGVILYFFEDYSAKGVHAWDKVIWNLSLEYTPETTTLIYGRISTGYRAGSFSLCDFCGVGTILGNLVEEETLINYEAGIKGLFLDQRLNLRAAAFYNDYDGYQINAIQHRVSLLESPFSESPLVEFIDNIDGTTIWGVEAEATYYISENLRISGFYNYLNSDFGPFESIVSGDPDPNIQLWAHLDWDTGEEVLTPYSAPKTITGGKLPMQPRHKAAVTLTYETALDGNLGNLQILGTISHTGDRFPQVQNVADQRLPAYERVDVRGTWTSVDQRWSLTLYVQNAMDEIGLQEVRVGRAPVGTLTEHRQFGLQIGWRPEL